MLDRASLVNPAGLWTKKERIADYVLANAPSSARTPRPYRTCAGSKAHLNTKLSIRSRVSGARLTPTRLYLFSDAPDRQIYRGTTHLQLGWSWNGKELMQLKPEFKSKSRLSEFQLKLDKRNRYLLNPGSVGQPRDRDWRAAFAVYDDTKAILTWHRVPYRARIAQNRIVRAGLPDVFATRLRDGT